MVIILLSCATVSPVDMARERHVPSAAAETVIPQWRPFGDTSGAIAWFAGKTKNPKIEFYALRIDMASPGLRIMVRGGAGYGAETLSTRVSSFVRDNGLLAGINAVPFNIVSAKEGKPIINEGIVISGGIEIARANPLYDAIIWRSGRVSIVSQAQIHSAENIENAVGGFHMILETGELTGRVMNREQRHPRSAAGISADGRYLYFLVIDGRRIGSIGSTEAETALFLRALGAWDGINLDGGGSSSMALRYPDGKVRVANTPVHGGVPGRERAVAGCIGVYTINPSTGR